MPARLRAKSGVLKPVHLDATRQRNTNPTQNQNQNEDKNQGPKKNKNKHDARDNNQARSANRSTPPTKGQSLAVSQQNRQKHSSTYHNVGKVCRGAAGGVSALTWPQKQNVVPARNHILLPKGRTRQNSRAIRERMKHPKLVGADVYVARLANSTSSPVKQPESSAALSRFVSDDVPLSEASASTGSLHDELTCKPSMPIPLPLARFLPTRTAIDSRPCYRCVCYMHSVGIKRVFWTNGEGRWEVAKVRDLVDMLEGSASGSGSDAVSGLGVFVTKHEVLMLRRLLGS